MKTYVSCNVLVHRDDFVAFSENHTGQRLRVGNLTQAFLIARTTKWTAVIAVSNEINELLGEPGHILGGR